MKKGTKHVLVGTSIASVGVGAAAAVRRAFAKFMVNIALDREVPKHNPKYEKKLSGNANPVPEFVETAKEAAYKLKQAECETVEIASTDGTRLIGHWRECEKAERVIIAMHGWRSSWTNDFGCIADFWYENGCNVLFAEQRGQGESGGDYMGFGMLERFDCLDWVNWVNETKDDQLPIYLCGTSMGAATVLMAAGLKLPENVHGIMADSGFTSAAAIWKHVAEDNLGISYGVYSTAANDLCRKKIQVGGDEYSTLDAMRECKVPIMLVHGTDDHFVPIEMTYENYKACTTPKKLFIVPGAEHCMSYLTDKDGYEKAVREFWYEFD